MAAVIARPPKDPAPQLTTERVRGQRRAAAAVVAVVMVIVGAFIWKPWDSKAGPQASTVVAAIDSPTPAEDASPSPVDASIVPGGGFIPVAPAPVPRPLFEAPDDLGTVLLATESGPFVDCLYDNAKAGKRPLARMAIAAPTVTTGIGVVVANIKRVDWHVEIEVNSETGLFNAEWQPVRSTPKQRSKLVDGRIVTLSPIDVNLRKAAAPTAGIFRVAVVIDWVDKSGKAISQRLYPHSYGSSDSAIDPSGCVASMQDDLLPY